MIAYLGLATAGDLIVLEIIVMGRDSHGEVAKNCFRSYAALFQIGKRDFCGNFYAE